VGTYAEEDVYVGPTEVVGAIIVATVVVRPEMVVVRPEVMVVGPDGVANMVSAEEVVNEEEVTAVGYRRTYLS
jgi:hypothetical protein